MQRILELILLMVMLTACSIRKPVVTIQHSDSLVVHYKIDSVTIHQYDSVFIDRYLKGDTMYITRERWRVEYKDRIREVRDTITQTLIKYQEREVKYIPSAYKWSMGIMIILIIAIVMMVAWKIYKKIRL